MPVKMTRLETFDVPNPEGFLRFKDIFLIENTPAEQYDGEYAAVQYLQSPYERRGDPKLN